MKKAPNIPHMYISMPESRSDTLISYSLSGKLELNKSKLKPDLIGLTFIDQQEYNA